MAIGDLTITAERMINISFSVPYLRASKTILMKRQGKRTSTLFKYATIFEATVWVAFAAAYFVASMAMAFFDRFSPYSARNIEKVITSTNVKL